MAITIHCACGEQFRAADNLAGQMVACPACARQLAVPAADAAIQPAATPTQGRRRRWEDEQREEPAERQVAKPRRRTSGKAIASLILGVLSFCVPVIPSLLAVLFGILGLRDISRGQGRVSGKGLAIGGLLTGLVGLLVCTPGMILGVLIPGFTFASDAHTRPRSQNNLKQIGWAMHSYHDSNMKLPPAVICDEQGKPLLSWRVLLPYLEESNLYNQFHFNESWDSPHNLTLLARMPNVYAPVKNVSTAEPYSTFYQVFDGPFQQSPGPIWRSGLNDSPPLPERMPAPKFELSTLGGPKTYGRGQPMTLMRITDGTSNTFMVVEAGQAVPWTKPADIPYHPQQPLPKLGGLYNGDFNVCFADGSVRLMRASTPESTLRLFITCDDGMTIPSWD